MNTSCGCPSFFVRAELDGYHDQDALIYHFKPEGLWSNSPVFYKQSDNYYFYQTDHIGVSHLIFDAKGVTLRRNEPDALGNIHSIGESNNKLRLPGQMVDEESGYYYNYWRQYNSKTGRYLSSDPAGLQGGINLYAYPYRNPLKRIDPFGLFGLEYFECLTSKMVEHREKNPVDCWEEDNKRQFEKYYASASSKLGCFKCEVDCVAKYAIGMPATEIPKQLVNQGAKKLADKFVRQGVKMIARKVLFPFELAAGLEAVHCLATCQYE